jgi:predicted nuclease of predicted toxin-antitoxin system
MRFKVDENLPAELVSDLTSAGHDAESIFAEKLTGSPDPEIMQIAQREKRVFLTMDKGIANVRSYPPNQFVGIVLFRPKSQGRGETLTFVRRHLPALLAADMAGHLLVVTESGIRIR